MKFQSVDNLTVKHNQILNSYRVIINILQYFIQIFVADNQGDEETTQIQNLIIIGKTVATTNMSEFKRVSCYSFAVINHDIGYVM